jgi:diguanylate cyclase
MTAAPASWIVERRRPWLLLAPVAAVPVALIASRSALGLGGTAYDHAFEILYSACELAAAVICLARARRRDAERVAWLLLGLATLTSFLGDALEYALYGNGDYPTPGLLDVFWLANYPLAAAGLTVLVAVRFQRPEPARWLEGLQATMIVAALGLLAVFQPALDRTNDTTAGTVVTLAYPVLDIILMAAVLTAFALSGFRPGRAWIVLAAGLTLFACVDSVWAVTGRGSITGWPSDLITAGWPAAHFVVAAGAWTGVTKVARVGSDDWRTALLPQAVVLLTISIQLGAIFHYLPGGFPIARAFLIAAQVVVLVKLASGPRVARRALRRDPLTGLGNRRAFEVDLARTFRPRAPGSVLTLCELRGLDAYAHLEGRAARDELLRRSGARLAETGQSVYRIEGGEFWLLGDRAPRPGLVDDAIPTAVASVMLPDEAADPATARALVEQRSRASYTAESGSE